MTETKPCPFCGGNEFKKTKTYIRYGTSACILKCVACAGRMVGLTHEETLKKWNKRAECLN